MKHITSKTALDYILNILTLTKLNFEHSLKLVIQLEFTREGNPYNYHNNLFPGYIIYTSVMYG